MRWFIVISLLVSLVCTGSLGSAHAYKIKKKHFKYFDINEDGTLSRYEFSLLQTHLIKGYPMITKKKQLAYDFNQSHLLEPFELKLYKQDKKAGTLRKLPKEKKEKIVVYEGGVRYKTKTVVRQSTTLNSWNKRK